MNAEVASPTEAVEKVVLDDFALVTKGDDEFLVTRVGVDLHDMMKKGPAADFHHWLGLKGSLLGQPCPQSTGKKDCLHGNSPRARSPIRDYFSPTCRSTSSVRRAQSSQR